MAEYESINWKSRPRLRTSSRARRSIAVVSAVITLLVASAIPASAEQKGYKAVADGSTVFIQISKHDTPSWCSIFSTSAWAGTTRGIQAGAFDCSPGPGLDNNPSCVGNLTFGETYSNTGGYHCHPVGGWSTAQFGAEVNRIDTTTYRAYVSGTVMATQSSWTGSPYQYVWMEWDSTGTSCPAGLTTDVHFSGWEYRPPGSSSWVYISSAANHINGPSNCMTLGSYSAATHGFEVFR